MKLKKLRLTDVLSHVDTRIDLAPNVNVFAGVSESGKSSVMRGLLQCLANKPAGIDLLRHGAKRGACSEVEVVAEMDDGSDFTVLRRRGKSANEYYVDGRKLLAFGQEAPVEVSERLRLSEHAFQLQWHKNFMLSETDGQVARMLSATVGLAEIDAAFAKVREMKSAVDERLRSAEADVRREEESLPVYAGTDEALAAAGAHDACEAALAEAEGSAESARLAAERISSIPGDRTDEADGARFWLARAEAKFKEASDAAEKRDAADSTLSALKRLPGDEGWRVDGAREDVLTLAERLALAGAAADAAAAASGALRSLRSIPADAGGRAVCASVAKYALADEARESAESDLAEAAGALARLRRFAPADAADAECAFDAYRASAGRACEAATEFEAASFALEKLWQAYAASRASLLAEEAAEEDMKRFMDSHPVCPECGALQEHWRI